MAVDLRFRFGPLPGPPYDLRFGGDGVLPDGEDRELEVHGVLPATLFGDVGFVTVRPFDVHGELPTTLFGDFTFEYQSRAARPVASTNHAKFQQAKSLDVPFTEAFQKARHFETPVGVNWRDGVSLDVEAVVRAQAALRMHLPQQSKWRDAVRKHPQATLVRFQTGLPLDNPLGMRDQYALRADGPPVHFRWQESIHTERPKVFSRFQDGISFDVPTRSGMQQGIPFIHGRNSRYQDAIKPGPGMWVRPPFVPDPCYIPPKGDEVHLRFNAPWTGSLDLLFTCETHGGGPGPEPGDTIVVPIKRVYLVINAATLTRLDTGEVIHIEGMSVSINVDSYTWSFSANLPGNQLSKVLQVAFGEPVAVQAEINGTAFVMVIREISRSRTFGNTSISISGNGMMSMLDAPYARTINFASPDNLTAAQMMDLVLMDNGVPLPDWTVDFGLDDWAVPGGVWSHQGTYATALADIAGAAGGYLQTHPSLGIIYAKQRYPLAPWDWAGITPDFELPSAVVQQEGIQWIEKPPYNRVFVSGVNAGILGRVTRDGTAGDILAPGVTHPLITASEAARGRGRTVLSDTGRFANVTLNMPVLAETGVIAPGRFVRYVDGATTRIGLTRGVTVNVGFPEIWQSLTVETHEED